LIIPCWAYLVQMRTTSLLSSAEASCEVFMPTSPCFWTAPQEQEKVASASSR